MWPFSPTDIRYLLGRELDGGLFFRLGNLSHLTTSQETLLASNSLPPDGR